MAVDPSEADVTADHSDPVVAYLIEQRAKDTDPGGLLHRDWWKFWDDRLTEYRASKGAPDAH